MKNNQVFVLEVAMENVWNKHKQLVGWLKSLNIFCWHISKNINGAEWLFPCKLVYVAAGRNVSISRGVGGRKTSRTGARGILQVK